MRFALLLAVPLFLWPHFAFGMSSDIADMNERMTPELNSLYNETMSALQAQSPEMAQRLRASEREWIKFRDLECEFSSMIGEAGYTRPYCENRLLQRRLEDLRRYRDFFIPEEKRKPSLLHEP